MAGHSPKPPTSDGLPAGSWLQRNGVYLLAVGLAVAAWSAFLVDLPLARFAATRSLPRELSKLFALSEVFSHGLGVLLIVVAVAVLDRTSWRKLPRLLATSFGTGILANLVKATVRPTCRLACWMPSMAGCRSSGLPMQHPPGIVACSLFRPGTQRRRSVWPWASPGCIRAADGCFAAWPAWQPVSGSTPEPII
jgi:hypothetical protein